MEAATFWMTQGTWGLRKTTTTGRDYRRSPTHEIERVLSFPFFPLLGLFLPLESDDDPGLHTLGCREGMPRQHSKQHSKLSDPKPGWYTDCIQPHGCRADHRGLSGEEKYTTGHLSAFHELGTHRHIGQMLLIPMKTSLNEYTDTTKEMNPCFPHS